MGHDFQDALLQFGIIPSMLPSFFCRGDIWKSCQLRCIYRTIELAQGLGNGYLMDHEGWFPQIGIHRSVAR